MMVVQIGSALLGCLRVIIGLFLIAETLHIKRPSKKEMGIGFGIGILLEVVVLILMPESNQLVQFAGEAIVAAFLAEYFQKGTRKNCLFVSIYAEIAFALCEFLTGVLLGSILKNQNYLEHNQMQGVMTGWISVFVILLIMLLLLVNPSAKANRTRVLFAIAFLMFFALASLPEQNTIQIPQENLIMWIILAMNLLFGILVFNVNKQYKMEKQLADLREQQAALLEKDYTDLNNAYAVNAKLFHDFHNHIGMIRQLISSEKYGDAISYLDELQAPIHEMTNTRWTGEQTIDYLINEKLTKAAEYAIDMQVEVEYPNHSNIKSVDMCAILGNLLDNALEAAKQVPQEDARIICLVIRRINQMLVIKVENSFVKAVIQEDGQLKTTKTEGGLHGWGMKSVKTAVDKYEGTVQHSQDGQIFKVVATLSFEGVEI